MNILIVMGGTFIVGVIVGVFGAWLIDDSVSDDYMRHGYLDDDKDEL